MGKEDLLIKAGIELLRMLLSGAAKLAQTLEVPDDKIDEAFAAAKEEFKKHDPNDIGYGT